MPGYQSCPICGLEYAPRLYGEPGAMEKIRRWRGGELIQKVWPDATPEEREQVQTGICSDACWQKATEEVE